jgi:hypothetical protein
MRIAPGPVDAFYLCVGLAASEVDEMHGPWYGYSLFRGCDDAGLVVDFGRLVGIGGLQS